MFHMILAYVSYYGYVQERPSVASRIQVCFFFGPQEALDPETFGTLLTYLCSSFGHGITLL